jgi:hypothetical protein
MGCVCLRLCLAEGGSGFAAAAAADDGNLRLLHTVPLLQTMLVLMLMLVCPCCASSCT